MTSGMLELLKKQGKVTRSNALARSRHQLGLMQNRVMYLLFSRIQRNDGKLLVQQIPIAEIRDKLRGNYGSFYEELRAAVTDLVGQKLHVEKANGGWKVMSWLTSAEYVRAGERSEGFDFLEIKLHEDLGPHLLQLKEKYNSIPLDALLSLASANSQRLIDILWHDSFAGERHELLYDIDDLKTRLNLTGKYERFRDFTRVLDRVQQEFAVKTPLRFTYEGIKTGRAWQAIRFEIWFEGFDTSPRIIDQSDPHEVRKQLLTQKLQDAGYTQDIPATLAQYGLDEVEEVLKQARAAERRSANSHTPVRNLGGLIHKMLNSGVGKHPPSSKPAGAAVTAERQKMDDAASTIVNQFLDSRTEYAQDVWRGLTESEHDAFRNELRQTLNGFLLREIDKADWQGLIFEQARNELLSKNGRLTYPAVLSDVEAYCKEHALLADLSEPEQKKVMQQILSLKKIS